MSHKWIYDKVNLLIKEHQTRDPKLLAEELDIKIKYLGDTKSLLGMYKVILKTPYIFIPANLCPIQNTVLAHELGHDQLHREYCLDGGQFYESKIFNPTNIFEIEANIFAAHLLTADEDLLKHIKTCNNYTDLASELDVDTNLLSIKISEMLKLGILDQADLKLTIPDARFLKEYKPQDENW